MGGCRLVAPWPAARGLILLYHSIGSTWGVPTEAFRWQLSALASSYQIVLLRDLPVHLETPSGRPVACVTFDDGYLDNAEVATPIMAEYAIPATFFVVTSLLGRSFANSFGRSAMMSAEDVQALESAGHEIGAHTVTHPKLTAIDRQEAEREVRQSKEHLESLLGSSVVSFAYPKGRWDAAVRATLSNAGYVTACTIVEKHLPPSPDLLALPRISVLAATTRAQFRAKLSRGLAIYEGIVRG